jgi:hypothetical protein
MTVTAASRQSWYDLAIQYTGYAWNAAAIAMANGTGPEINPEAGRPVVIPDTLPVNRAVVEFYAAKRIAPATGTIKNRLTLSTNRLVIAADGTAKTVTVTANTEWSAS